MIGKTLGHYQITEKLGAGGMGVVYKAEDTILKRTAGMRFLSEQVCKDRHAPERLQREVLTASTLDRSNTSTLRDSGAMLR